MGLSEAEEWAAREIDEEPQMNFSEMRPVTEIELDSFLVAESPFLARHAWAMQAYVQELPPLYPDFIEHYPNLTYYCEFKTAQSVATALNAHLPREYQREYFCRGNTTTLFCFGNSLPASAELTNWFNYGFDNLSKVKRNDFGIGGLFITEWCDDLFRYDYSSGKVAEHTQVLRGGGADFCHWRNNKNWDPLDSEDWIWCTSAVRIPSTYLKNDKAGFRLVIDLNK